MLRNLIVDEYFSKDGVKPITEKKSLPPGVIMQVSGPVGIINTENKNGRYYSTDFWENVLARPEVKECMEQRGMVGAADHPKTLTPPIATVSHIVTDAWIEGDALMSDADIIDTPMGRIVKAIYDAGGRMGASTRGAGKTVKKGGKNEVAHEGYKWGGWDFCFDPSAQNAFPGVKEKVEEIIVNATLEQLGEDDESKFLYKEIMEKLGCNLTLLDEKYEDSDPSADPGFFCAVVKSKADVEKALEALKIDNYEIIAENDEEVVVKFSDKSDRAKFMEKAPSIIKGSSKSISDSSSDVEELKQKCLALTEQFLKLSKGQSVSIQLDEMSSQVSILKQQTFDLKKQLEKKDNENKELSQQVSELKDSVSTLEKEIKSLSEGADDCVDGANEEIDRLKKENDSLYRKYVALKNESSSLTSTVVSLKEELKSSSRSKSILSSKVEALESDCDSLHTENQELKTRFYSIKSGISEAEIVSEGLVRMSIDEFESVLEDIKPVQPEESFVLEDRRPKVVSMSINEQTSNEKSSSRKNAITSILKRMN